MEWMYYLIKVDGKVGNREGKTFGIFLALFKWVRHNQRGDSIPLSTLPPTLILHSVSDRLCSILFTGSLFLPISIHLSYCEEQTKEMCSRGMSHISSLHLFHSVEHCSTATFPARCLIKSPARPCQRGCSIWKFKPCGLMGKNYFLHNVKTSPRLAPGLCQTAGNVACMPAAQC